MNKSIKPQFGFTLIEVLVASFIFASVLAVVYGLLNDTLISKKELELNLTVNEQVKNANEILQSVMRQANGDFFTDGEFPATQPVPTDLSHLFFVSSVSANPINSSIPFGWNTATSEKNLYIKVNNDTQKEIYAFYFRSDAGTYHLYLQSWKKLAQDTKWSQDQPETKLLDCAPGGNPFFEIPKQVSNNNPKSVYNPNAGQLPPMDLYVHLKVIAKSQTSWKNRFFEREMNQIYVPLITSNPYL